jgi:hypothetical protein
MDTGENPHIPEAQVVAPLTYAPPARDPRRATWVIVFGLLTSGIALLLVWMLERYGKFSIMGLYANGILPAGAFLVGMGAGLGYGITSWWTGVKVRRGLLWLVLLLQLASYAGAQYLEFCARGPLGMRRGNTVQRIAFVEYYHLRAINFRWESKTSHDKPGEPLGGWGYVFRILEILGFVAGGVVAPAAMMKVPYCDLCQMYMKQKKLAGIPASALKAKAPKEEHQAVAEAARRKLDEVREAALRGDAAAFNQHIVALAEQTKVADKYHRRVHIKMDWCRNCHSGTLRPTIVTGQGKQIHTENLPTINLEHDFVQQVVPEKK